MVDHDVMTGGPCGKGGGHVSLPPLTSEPNVHNCLQMFAIMLQRALLCPLLMFSIGVTSYSPIVWHRPKGSSRIVWKCAQNNSAHTILYKLRKKLWDITCRGEIVELYCTVISRSENSPLLHWWQPPPKGADVITYQNGTSMFAILVRLQ